MDTHEEIYEFIQGHAAAFSGIRDISSAVNAFHLNQSRWEREKEWALAKERQAKKPDDDRAAPRSSAPLTTQITETVRRMKAMYKAGSTVEEMAERIPCWIDDTRANGARKVMRAGSIVGTNPNDELVFPQADVAALGWQPT